MALLLCLANNMWAWLNTPNLFKRGWRRVSANLQTAGAPSDLMCPTLSHLGFLLYALLIKHWTFSLEMPLLWHKRNGLCRFWLLPEQSCKLNVNREDFLGAARSSSSSHWHRPPLIKSQPVGDTQRLCINNHSSIFQHGSHFALLETSDMLLYYNPVSKTSNWSHTHTQGNFSPLAGIILHSNVFETGGSFILICIIYIHENN